MIGSIWHRWDLHVHTPASFEHQFKLDQAATENEYEDLIWEKYISALESECNVPAIGITDYFSIEGYKRVSQERAKGRLGNYELILPNVEFRLNTIFTRENGKPESVNFHIVFSDQVNPTNIEKDFLENVQFRTPNGEKRSLTRTNLEALGKLLKEQYENFRDKPDYFVGCLNAKVDLAQIEEVLNSSASLFDGNYIKILAPEGFKRTDWEGQAHNEWKQLFNAADAIFSGHPQTRDYHLGKVHNSAEDYVKSFGSFKPCLHGSDAHRFNKLFKPDLDRYCWIKGERTFSGLKQVIFEPELRVNIAKTKPDAVQSAFVVTEVELSKTKVNDRLSLHHQPIPMNNGLVAIIGGKGDGKTALLDLIANCFEDRCKRNRKERADTSSFVQRIEEDSPQLKTSLQFKNGETWSKSLTDENTFGKTKVTYMPQGKIDEFSSNAEKLHRKITELIFSSDAIAESDLVNKYYELGKEIEGIQSLVTETLGSVESYERDTSDEKRSELQESLDLRKGELEDLELRLQQIEVKDGEEVSTLNEQVTALKEEVSVFDELFTEIEDYGRNIVSLLGMNRGAKQITDRLQELGWRNELPQISFAQMQVRLEEAQKFLTESKEAKNLLILEIGSKLKALSESQQRHAEVLAQIAQKNEEIEGVENSIKAFEEKKRDAEALRLGCTDHFLEYLEKLNERRENYDAIIALFSEGKDQIMSSIDFEARIAFEKEKFLESARNHFHRRSVTDEYLDDTADLLKELGENPNNDLSRQYEERLLSIKDSKNPSRSHADLYRLMYQQLFRVETEVYFDGKPMRTLSMGQKGTVLLTIFLAEGEHLLILDQPEENLDNRFIYEVLVGAIREAKKRRQIIMATHNANLVVNADAEQVIVAENQNGFIRYQAGALENKVIRDAVTTLLEGGVEAFRNREKRYRD